MNALSRIKNLTKTVLLTFLILSSFIGSWLFIKKKTKQRQAQSQVQSIVINKKKPTGFTNKIVYRDIDEEGHLKNQIRSDQLTHYPQEDTAQFKLPQFVLHGEEGNLTKSMTPWVITAKRAETLKGNKVIKLYGQVAIDRTSTEKEAEKHLRTEELTFHSKENRLETKHPVVLWQPNATIHADGLIADLSKDTVIFLKNTRIVYKPSKLKSSKEDPNESEKHFKTNQLKFHPKANLLETQDPIILEQAGTTVYATGLKADLNQNTVTFLSNTKIIYTPNKLPTKKAP